MAMMIANICYDKPLHIEILKQALESKEDNSNLSKIVADDGIVFVPSKILRIFSPMLNDSYNNSHYWIRSAVHTEAVPGVESNEYPTIILPEVEKQTIVLLLMILIDGGTISDHSEGIFVAESIMKTAERLGIEMKNIVVTQKSLVMELIDSEAAIISQNNNLVEAPVHCQASSFGAIESEIEEIHVSSQVLGNLSDSAVGNMNATFVDNADNDYENEEKSESAVSTNVGRREKNGVSTMEKNDPKDAAFVDYNHNNDVNMQPVKYKEFSGSESKKHEETCEKSIRVASFAISNANVQNIMEFPDCGVECLVCLRFFPRVRALNNHMCYHLKTGKEFQCVHCGATFKETQQLKFLRRICLVHGRQLGILSNGIGDLPYCLSCKKRLSFKQDSDWNHLNTIHPWSINQYLVDLIMLKGIGLDDIEDKP